MANHGKISTFVFCDLEATGLPDRVARPRITELSLVAVHRESLQSPCAAHMPRILNKLTICIDPKKPISVRAMDLTGLYNDELQCQQSFNTNVVELCTAFLNHLAKPICLLAHNGFRFDFPLLAAELDNISRHFPAEVLCADTLIGFRHVCTPHPSPQQSIPSSGTQVEVKAARTLRFENPPRPFRMRLLDALEVPTDVTPHMQIIKQDPKRFGNAPEKKKPKCEDPPRDIRATSIKRKLFNESPDGMQSQMQDDVDRGLGMGYFQLSKGFEKGMKEDSIDSIQPLDGKESESDLLMHEEVKEVEDAPMSEQPRPGDSPEGAATIRDLPEPQESIQMECSPQPPDGSPEPIGQSLKSTPNPTNHTAASVAKQPTSPIGSTTQTQMVTTPVSVALTETFLTPSPSPHRSQSDQGSSCSSSPASGSSGSPRVSYTLSACHKRILGYDFPDAHNAESDCLALVRIFHKMSRELCDWADKSAVPFISITPMSTPVKRPKMS